jgi:hypothetical protein
MKKQEKPRPYIDYKTARVFVRMYDFIIHANQAQKSLNDELEHLIYTIRLFQEKYAPRENPEKWADALKRDHIPNAIANIRPDSWEAGLTQTLFEKLKDKQFRDRFTGWLGDPVLKEEIEDHDDV